MFSNEIRATGFCNKFNITIKVVYIDKTCPPWDDPSHLHGDRFRIYVHRTGTYKSLRYFYWNSYNESRAKKAPSTWDIIVNLYQEIDTPTDYQELMKNYGYTSIREAKEVAKWAYKVQNFFSEEEKETLREII